MDAKAIGTTMLLVVTCPAALSAARFETANFVITAPTEEFARQVGEAAEYYRHELAIEWLGEPLPGNWSSKCPITCKVGQIGAGGATTFTFNNGEVFGWHMSIQGSEERILDSVLPHEVSHMIFASHFRRPLPRWADEGAATLVEHESERLRQTKLLGQVLRTSRRIPLQQLLGMKEYPKDMQDVLTLYAEGYALADYLVQQKGSQGRRIYLEFLDDAHQYGWDAAFKKHYEITVAALEQEWTGWVMAGSPPLTPADETIVAAAEEPAPPFDPSVALERFDRSDAPARRGAATATMDSATVIRGQSADEPAPLPSVGRLPRSIEEGAEVRAPRPGELAGSTSAAAGIYSGERRMAAQPREPSIVEPASSESDATARESSAEPWADSIGSANPQSAGNARAISFDAPAASSTGAAPAPIGAADSGFESGAAGDAGSVTPGQNLQPYRRSDSRVPSYRGFTRGHSSATSGSGFLAN
jgi:hypothetical protein